MKAQLSSSEAIYAFCGWLTTRKEKTVMSASDDASIIAEKIKLFCDTNNLPEPRDHYTFYYEIPIEKRQDVP